MRGYEVASVEGDDEPMNAASLVKQVLGHLAFALIGDLDAPILDNITLRHVLSHTTGLPNWRAGDELTPLRAPGVQWGYSGEAFVLLQRELERRSGQRDRRARGGAGVRATRYARHELRRSRTRVPRLAAAAHDRVRLRPVPRPRLVDRRRTVPRAGADRRRARVGRGLGARARTAGVCVAVGPELPRLRRSEQLRDRFADVGRRRRGAHRRRDARTSALSGDRLAANFPAITRRSV